MPTEKKSSPKTLVMKFGGTSVGSPEAVNNAVQIIQQALPDWPHLVVVISAMSGVTNLLLDSASHAVQGDQDQIQSARETLLDKHQSIADAMISNSSKREEIMVEIWKMRAPNNGI